MVISSLTRGWSFSLRLCCVKCGISHYVNLLCASKFLVTVGGFAAASRPSKLDELDPFSIDRNRPWPRCFTALLNLHVHLLQTMIVDIAVKASIAMLQTA